jgi:hypothetical protein
MRVSFWGVRRCLGLQRNHLSHQTYAGYGNLVAGTCGVGGRGGGIGGSCGVGGRWEVWCWWEFLWVSGSVTCA